MLTQSPALVPSHLQSHITMETRKDKAYQLDMWSQAAFAADMALLSFLAAITAAPRFCTVGMNSEDSQAWVL